ncbi:hypothetical protein R1sor_001640 [Riccia sorocarpa]|uniref:Uncharacterized protein n=1 Tax=Riccia sorocarpa TaxID=122646 RepID=A0ABD3GXD3_9MARC
MADHRRTLEDRLMLHVETESQIDAENNIEWRWVVQDSVDRCVTTITDNELSPLGLHRTFRINWRIPEHERFASWFPHYDSVGKKIFVHTCTRQNWVPIIQVINIILLARPRPQELHGKLALTIVSKVDGEPACDYDWATLVLSDVEREIKALQWHIAKTENRKQKWTYVGIFIAHLCQHLAIEEDGRPDGNEYSIPQLTVIHKHLTLLYRLLIQDRKSPAVDTIQSDHDDPTHNHGIDGYPNIDPDHGVGPYPNIDEDLDAHEFGEGLQGLQDAYESSDANPGGNFEQDADQDDDADYKGAHRQNNVARDVEEDSGALPNADYDTRTSPSRRRPVTAEDVADLEVGETGFESSLQAAIRKHQQVEEDLNNKVLRKEEVEREIAEKEQFWDRYLRRLKVQVDGQKQCLNFLTKEGYLDPHVEVNRSNHDSAQGECSSRPRLFDGLLAAVQEAMESPFEEENLLGSLLAAIEQEAEHTNSPPRQSQEETDVEPTDPVHSSRLPDDVEGIDIFVDLVLDRESQKVPVPVHSDVLQPERIPPTFSCADQQLPVDNEDPRPERIPPDVSSQQNGCLPNEQMAEVITVDNVPVTLNTSPESLHGGPTAQEEGNENTRKEKRKAETTALVGSSSPSKRVATVLRPPQITFAALRSQHSPITQRRPPLPPPYASRGTARGQPSVVGRPPLPPAAATRGRARGQPSVVGRPPLPPAAATRGTARGRGKAGQTSARQVIGRGSSRGTKRSADRESVSQQAKQDDDDTDVWADFADYQARAAANAKTKKWEDWKREAFMTEEERAKRMRRIIAKDKAIRDAIVATFSYGARYQFDDRVGYDPPHFVLIPKDPPDPPRPRTPSHVQIERIRAEYADGTRDRSLRYQPTCEHGLAWQHCPLCSRKPWPPMRCWTDEDFIAVAEKAQFYHDWNGRILAEKRAKHVERRKRITRIIWNYENRRRRQIITAIQALIYSLEIGGVPKIGETSSSNKDG